MLIFVPVVRRFVALIAFGYNASCRIVELLIFSYRDG